MRMSKLLAAVPLLVLIALSGCCGGMIEAVAVKNTVTKVTYQFEDLIDGTKDPSTLTALEKRVYKRSAALLRQTVAKALKLEDLPRPEALWGRGTPVGDASAIQEQNQEQSPPTPIRQKQVQVAEEL